MAIEWTLGENQQLVDIYKPGREFFLCEPKHAEIIRRNDQWLLEALSIHEGGVLG